MTPEFSATLEICLPDYFSGATPIADTGEAELIVGFLTFRNEKWFFSLESYSSAKENVTPQGVINTRESIAIVIYGSCLTNNRRLSVQ